MVHAEPTVAQLRATLDLCLGRGLTEEHPLSESLRRGRNIQVEVTGPDADGNWETKVATPSMPMRHASAKILCQDHNNALSPADEAALHLQNALQEIDRRDQSPVVCPTETVVINGRRFAQFLCKYAVGSFVISDPDTPPSRDLVLYAFGKAAARPLHFYFLQAIGDKPRFGRTDNAPIRRICSDTDPAVAYVVTVAGLRTIVTQLAEGDPLLPVLMDLVAPGAQWMNRLRGINSPIKGETYHVAIDRSEDPFESRLLGPSGLSVNC